MATNGTDNAANGANREHDLEKATSHMTQDERRAALHAAKFGYGPLAHIGSKQAAEALPGEHDIVLNHRSFLLTTHSFRWRIPTRSLQAGRGPQIRQPSTPRSLRFRSHHFPAQLDQSRYPRSQQLQYHHWLGVCVWRARPASCWYVVCTKPNSLNLHSASNIRNQGDGSRQHVRCHGPVVLRWLLDFLRHHPDPRWVCSRRNSHLGRRREWT